MRQYAREQYERDLYVGRSEYQKRHEAYQEWKQEHCMSGTAMTENDSSVNQMLKEFVELHLQHARDARSVREFLEKTPDAHVFVRVDGELYTVSRHFGLSYELPVVVRKATVIEG